MFRPGYAARGDRRLRRSKLQTPVNRNDPTTQWSGFVYGFQLADGTTRIGHPTGVAVGPSGSLFVADDQTGNIYIRP